MDPSALSVALLLGLASAAHCAGMCGVFALQTAGRPARTLAYLLGKTTTYVFLGALAGALGKQVGGLSLDAIHVLGWVAGGAMVLVALRTLLAPGARGLPAVKTWLAPFLRKLMPSGDRPFQLGAVTGLLPCGVTALAVLQALATGSALGGAAVMAAFGLGTMPVLAATAWVGGSLLKRLSPVVATRLGAVLVLTGGVLLILRSHDTGCPACSS